MATKKQPPMISYRHKKCWRVIAATRNNGKTIDTISGRFTYAVANIVFSSIVDSCKDTLVFCHIVAESDGIERVLK